MPHDLAEGYERLRDAARDRSRPLDGIAGLAIFVRNGMAAWMAACASVIPTMIDSAPGDRVVSMPLLHHQRDVIDVLATMVLTNTREVTA